MISTRGTNLAHHIDHDGTVIMNRNPHIGTLITGTQGAAQLGLGTCHRQATQRDGAIARHRYSPLRRNGMDAGLLGSTVDIDDHLVARAKHIVLRDWHIAIRLERQSALPKDVATKDPLALNIIVLALRSLDIVFHLIGLFAGIGIDLARSAYLGGIQLLRSRSILVLLKCFHRSRDSSSRSSYSTCYLTFILIAKAANLIHIHATLHQICHNLRLSRSRLSLTSNVVHHLLVGHTLGTDRENTDDSKEKNKKSFHINTIIINQITIRHTILVPNEQPESFGYQHVS